jgi:ABC-type oligopeptide transport system ATPase subunit
MVSLVLITGPSGCGKSSLAKSIVNLYQPSSVSEVSSKNTNKCDGHSNNNIILLHQDNYFTKQFIPYKERIDDSYEDDSGIDWDRLTKDITESQISNNTAVDLVVVEGHILSSKLIISSNQQQKLLHSSYFDHILIILISSTREVCRYRRMNRRKDRSEEEKLELGIYFDQFVWPSYLKHGLVAKQSFRDLVMATAPDTGSSTGNDTGNDTGSQDKDEDHAGVSVISNKISILDLKSNNDTKLKDNVDLVEKFMSDQRW